MDQVISLYKEEIATYQQQIEDLKQRNRDCDQKNATLIGKIQNLEDLVEKANVANRDLNIAFEHVHQENIRYQVNANNQDALAINNTKQVAETTGRKDELAAESLVWISEREQFKQRNQFLERECKRYHRDNMHLGKQVRHLLKTLEEERGMIIRRESQVAQENQITCAADVIDKHLITFESIEELQQQNQKLLSLVKNLSAEQEEREVKVESEEVMRLTTDLEELKTQLDTIKNDRERVLNALNTIHKERDLFKILLCKTRQVEHLTPEIFQRMVAVACSSGPAIVGPDSSSVEREAHIEDLKKMISNLERSIENIKRELDESRVSSAAELKVKNELLEKAHLKISEVMKTLEAANERNQLLETNINGLTTEFDDIRTKCQKMTIELEESTGKIENAENHSKELTRSLDAERKRAQDALIEASQAKEQSQLLQESLEREKRQRQQELTALFRELQDKQAQEFEVRSEKLMDLQQKLNQAYSDIFSIQMQRNFERERRIKLDKLLNGRPKHEVGQPEKRRTKFKRTQKRRQVRFSFPESNNSRVNLSDSYQSPTKSHDTSKDTTIESNNSTTDSVQLTPIKQQQETPRVQSMPEPMPVLIPNPMPEPISDPMQDLSQEHTEFLDSQVFDSQLQHTNIQEHLGEQVESCQMEAEDTAQINDAQLETGAEFTTLESNNQQGYEILNEIDNLENQTDEEQNINPTAKSGFIKLKRRKFD